MKFKKLFCIMLSLLITFSYFSVAASAIDQTYSAVEKIDLGYAPKINYGVDAQYCKPGISYSNDYIDSTYHHNLLKYNDSNGLWDDITHSDEKISEGKYKFKITLTISDKYSTEDKMTSNVGYRFVGSTTKYSINGAEKGTVLTEGSYNSDCYFYTDIITITSNDTIKAIDNIDITISAGIVTCPENLGYTVSNIRYVKAVALSEYLFDIKCEDGYYFPKKPTIIVNGVNIINHSEAYFFSFWEQTNPYDSYVSCDYFSGNILLYSTPIIANILYVLTYLIYGPQPCTYVRIALACYISRGSSYN